MLLSILQSILHIHIYPSLSNITPHLPPQSIHTPNSSLPPSFPPPPNPKPHTPYLSNPSHHDSLTQTPPTPSLPNPSIPPQTPNPPSLPPLLQHPQKHQTPQTPKTPKTPKQPSPSIKDPISYTPYPTQIPLIQNKLACSLLPENLSNESG